MKKTRLIILGIVLIGASGFAYSYFNNVEEACAKCTGSSSCSACTNCKYCKHCNDDKGTCGVCK